MGLPKIQTPIFEIEVPSIQKKMKFRPFTVKEEKILLTAQQDDNSEVMVSAIKQIIGNCAQGDLDPDTLATFDVEYILLNLRSQSVSNVMEFKIKDPDTEEDIKLEIRIEDIQVKHNPEHSKTIKLDDNMYVEMKYPTIDQMQLLDGLKGEQRKLVLMDILFSSMDKVVQGDEVYSMSDFSKQEVDDFIDSFTSAHAIMLKEFFETMPKMRFEQEYKTLDGTKKTFVVEGTKTFFI